MIEFDLNSFETLLPVLIKHAKEPSGDLFFNDGRQKHQVLKFKAHTDYFEGNGQYHEEVIGYTLLLANKKSVLLKANDRNLIAS